MRAGLQIDESEGDETSIASCVQTICENVDEILCSVAQDLDTTMPTSDFDFDLQIKLIESANRKTGLDAYNILTGSTSDVLLDSPWETDTKSSWVLDLFCTLLAWLDRLDICETYPGSLSPKWIDHLKYVIQTMLCLKMSARRIRSLLPPCQAENASSSSQSEFSNIDWDLGMIDSPAYSSNVETEGPVEDSSSNSSRISKKTSTPRPRKHRAASNSSIDSEKDDPLYQAPGT